MKLNKTALISWIVILIISFGIAYKSYFYLISLKPDEILFLILFLLNGIFCYGNYQVKRYFLSTLNLIAFILALAIFISLQLN
jgi:hypothetical protein